MGNQTTEHYPIQVSGPGVKTPPPPSRPKTVKPRLSASGQSARSWREPGGRRRGHGKRPAVGTRFRFTLNTSAAVTFTFNQSLIGRQVAHTCVRATEHNHRAKRCTSQISLGTLKLTGHAGVNTDAFRGTVSRRRLAPGRYAVTITATTGGGSVTRTLHFRIVSE